MGSTSISCLIWRNIKAKVFEAFLRERHIDANMHFPKDHKWGYTALFNVWNHLPKLCNGIYILLNYFETLLDIDHIIWKKHVMNALSGYAYTSSFNLYGFTLLGYKTVQFSYQHWIQILHVVSMPWSDLRSFHTSIHLAFPIMREESLINFYWKPKSSHETSYK